MKYQLKSECLPAYTGAPVMPIPLDQMVISLTAIPGGKCIARFEDGYGMTVDIEDAETLSRVYSVEIN